MASPKSKISRSKRGMRRSHSALNTPGTGTCGNCGALVEPHNVCKGCGYYKNREVLPAQN